MRVACSAAAAAALAALLVCACGDGPRPAVTESTSAHLYESAQPSEAEHCEPGAVRSCHVYYVDDQGRWQCPVFSQTCRADGLGWHACDEPPDGG